MTGLFNCKLKEKRIPTEWDISIIVNSFKQKGSYRGQKLLGHMVKIFERIIGQEIRKVVHISDMQFGFMPEKGTLDTIFIARQLQEKYLGKKKNLYFTFVDLEKAFDRVPRDVVRWVMRKLNIDEWLIETAIAMYELSNSTVRVNTVDSKFIVKVEVRQGSVPIPLLFIMVLEALSKEFKKWSTMRVALYR